MPVDKSLTQVEMIMDARVLKTIGIGLVLTGLSVGGCAQSPETTGVLSSYYKLEPAGAGTLRYVNSDELAQYSQFWVQPVEIHLHPGTKDLTSKKQELQQMKDLLYNAVVNELSANYAVVSHGGRGVAKVRMALTDIKQDTAALNVLPTTRLTGLGLGGAAMEAELVDSITGRQIAAVVQTRKSDPISLDGLSKWSSAQAVIKGWAKHFREKIDEAHGK